MSAPPTDGYTAPRGRVLGSVADMTKSKHGPQSDFLTGINPSEPGVPTGSFSGLAAARRQ
jgi:hypothetical protein